MACESDEPRHSEDHRRNGKRDEEKASGEGGGQKDHNSVGIGDQAIGATFIAHHETEGAEKEHADQIGDEKRGNRKKGDGGIGDPGGKKHRESGTDRKPDRKYRDNRAADSAAKRGAHMKISRASLLGRNRGSQIF